MPTRQGLSETSSSRVAVSITRVSLKLSFPEKKQGRIGWKCDKRPPNALLVFKAHNNTPRHSVELTLWFLEFIFRNTTYLSILWGVIFIAKFNFASRGVRFILKLVTIKHFFFKLSSSLFFGQVYGRALIFWRTDLYQYFLCIPSDQSILQC